MTNRAYEFWKECGERERMCCGGLSHGSEEDYYFHGKYWDSSYPLTKKGKPRQRGPVVCVESGVNFYANHAETYWILDTDDLTQSMPYGPDISYPASVDDETFWEALEKQVYEGAEYAWNDSWLTNSHGCHYNVEW